jgi:putative tricarboxylic transport membrane protein
VLTEILGGFQTALDPANLLAVLAGTLLGIVIGAVPGLDASVGTALVIPLTYGLTPVQAINMLAGIYAGGVYGGQIPAMLFRVPGASEAVMTTLDGYPMAQRGEAGRALGLGLAASVLGGLFGAVVMIFLTPPLADFALEFGPAEYFALAVLGMTAISSLGTRSQGKAMLAGLAGMLIASVGIDPITGISRLTFGSPALLGGVSFIPLIVGLFAAAEVYNQIRARAGAPAGEEVAGARLVRVEMPPLRDLWPLRWVLARGAIVGTWIGILPGVGATTAAIIGYAQAVRFSRHPERFGTGIPEGIVSAETANNAAASGAMIPLLALGIPGSATTAIMVGAFLLHGLRLGPLFLQQQRPLAFAIFAGVVLANLIFFAAGLVAVGLFARLLRVPYPYLAANILAFAAVGAAALGDIYGMKVMFLFSIVGFLMESLGFPVAPLVLGYVLGPIAETALRRALLIVDFDLVALLTRPITAALLLLALASGLYPLLRSRGALGAAQEVSGRVVDAPE